MSNPHRIDGNCGVTTTAGEAFTHTDGCVLAAFVLARFGYNQEAAAEAWRKMHENDSTVAEFMELATPGKITLDFFRRKWNA